jgi:hypothetical protein
MNKHTKMSHNVGPSDSVTDCHSEDCLSLALHVLLYGKPTGLWSSGIRYMGYPESLTQSLA